MDDNTKITLILIKTMILAEEHSFDFNEIESLKRFKNIIITAQNLADDIVKNNEKRKSLVKNDNIIFDSIDPPAL